MNEQKGTILITGSSGRIGYPLARRLAESFNVVGFDRRAPSHPPPSAECLYVDLTIDESLRRGLQAIRELHGSRIVSVIHLAAYNDFSGAPSPLYDEVTVRGTERLLRMLQDFEVEQFRCAAAGFRSATRSPATERVPRSGWCAPVTILINVLLPAPFSPSSACTSPARKSKSTPRSARAPPNDLAS
jgi:nucleoside-diphosphate-sugar epimerase